MSSPDAHMLSHPHKDSVTAADHSDPGERKLRRQLTNRHIQLISIGGAVGTGLFMGSDKTIATAGPSIILIYAIIGIVLFLFMRAMGELFLSDSRYGSFAEITRDLLGPWAGFVTGWTYWLCWIVSGCADLVAITSYMRVWWPNLPAYVSVTGITIILLLLNILTVKAFGETEFWFSIIKIVTIVALIVVGIVMVVMGVQNAKVSNLWAAGIQPNGSVDILKSIFPKGFSGFLGGFQIAIFAFVGIELVGTAAAETADPKHTLPKAINSIPLRVMLFYVLALSVIMMVIPYTAISANPERSPFVEMFMLTGLPAAGHLVNFVVITAAASSANSGIYSTSRMLYGLSRRYEANRIFGKLSKRHVPQNALLLSCILLQAAIAVVAMGKSLLSGFTLATSMSACLFMAIWTLITVSYIVFRHKKPELHKESVFKVPGGLISAWFVVIFMALACVILCLETETRIGLIAALVWLLFIFVVSIIVRQRNLAHASKKKA